MCLKRSKTDVLKAYMVYKHVSEFLSKIPPTEVEEYVLLSTLTTLYDGLTLVEIANVLPVGKACIKKLVNNGVRKYRIFNFDDELQLGRESLGGRVAKGVLTLKPHILENILKNNKGETITKKDFVMFTTLLSNTSAHVKIFRDHLTENTNKVILSHLRALFDMIVKKQLSSNSTCLGNLTKLGYMRLREQNIELNQRAFMYNKESAFELRTI